MVIVVTGGAGFIGSHLCEFLLKYHDNAKVLAIDNLFTGNKSNIEQLLDNPRFSFRVHDIIDPLFLDDVLIDQIYNLACPASPIHYQFNAIRTSKANSIGVINMLGLAKRHKARFLQASTSEIYGDPLIHPQLESYAGNVSPTGPRSCYDEGKRFAESLCFSYLRQNQVDIRVARIFNTYGTNMAMNDGRVISNFVMQALQGKPLTITGDGSHTRSFCYVTDTVHGLVSLMEKENIHGPINIGNPDEHTVQAIAEKIIDLTNSKSKIEYYPLPEDDPKVRRPDISLAKSILKWEPRILLDEGLYFTIEYFKSKLGLPNQFRQEYKATPEHASP